MRVASWHWARCGNKHDKKANLPVPQSSWGLSRLGGEDPWDSSHQSDVLTLQRVCGFKEKAEHFRIQQHSIKERPREFWEWCKTKALRHRMHKSRNTVPVSIQFWTNFLLEEGGYVSPRAGTALRAAGESTGTADPPEHLLWFRDSVKCFPCIGSSNDHRLPLQWDCCFPGLIGGRRVGEAQDLPEALRLTTDRWAAHTQVCPQSLRS